MWACFIFSALDVLSIPLESNERANIRTWVLSLQHPDGGFCGSPTHAHEGQDASKGNANIAATFFALVLLAVAAEDDDGGARAAFSGVRRRRLLRWLRRLQREDGSFGQNLWDGEPVGGSDTRHSYLACSIRWMVRGDVRPGDEAWEEDIDVVATVGHIRQGQTYDGGLAEFYQHESHGALLAGLGRVHVLTLVQRAMPTAPSQPCLSSTDRCHFHLQKLARLLIKESPTTQDFSSSSPVDSSTTLQRRRRTMKGTEKTSLRIRWVH